MPTPLTVGSQVPNVIFKTRILSEASNPNVCYDGSMVWKDVTTADIFNNKKVVLFSLPGAFTPTCSSTHLPGYETNYNEFKKLGIDDVICMSVNDTFVMNQWAKNLEVKNVHILSDGNGDFTRGMGMLVKKENLGFGERSWRYSMMVDNGVIVKLFIEPGISDNFESDPFEVSDAGTMLAYLKSL